MKKSISIVIPCYNCEESITELVDEIFQEQPESEVILINDGSADSTWKKILSLSKKYTANVIAIDLFKNSGQHNALYIGIEEAKGDLIITMDDDLQHNPADLKELIEECSEGVDLVYGIPRNGKHTLWRRLSSWLCKLAFDRILKMENVAESSAFRVFSKEASVAFSYFKGGVVDIDAILSWTVNKVKFIEVNYRERQYGTSNYNFFKLLDHAAKMAVAFSSMPLILSLYVGLITLLIAFCMILYILFMYFFIGLDVPGFAFLAVTVLFFSGVQIFLIGIISRYIDSVKTQVSGRPIAAIRKKLKDF